MPQKIDECALNIFDQLGHAVLPGQAMLDFGCGNGTVVRDLQQRGIDAWGCDLAFKDGEHVEALAQEERIRLIDSNNYRLPFDDNSFDFIVSNQVFEHVQNMDETISELRRVLKPGGLCLHLFPSKLKPIESHVLVPFASVIKSRHWLAFWYSLRIGRLKDGMAIRESARHYETYLRQRTNYLNSEQIRSAFGRHFENIDYAEKAFLAQSTSDRGRRLYTVAQKIPALFWLYRIFWARVLVTY